jgi:hypothetical protein
MIQDQKNDELKLKSGCYIINNLKNSDEKYLILISGTNPFLKIEIIWNINENRLESKDIMRGKNFSWIHKNL